MDHFCNSIICVRKFSAISFLLGSFNNYVDQISHNFYHLPNRMDNCGKRENRLRESLQTFIALHNARAVYLWRLEYKQNFTQIQLLEILYVLVNANQNQKKTLFISHAPRNWAIAPVVSPRGPKYAQEPWKGSDLPQASEMGHSF